MLGVRVRAGVVRFALVASLFASVPAGSFDTPPFGSLVMLNASATPRPVILYLSGDGGWDQRASEMSRTLASLDALVIGVNLTSYRHGMVASWESCVDLGKDLDRLGRLAQQELGVHPRKPLLVGYSSGATLVYAALAQAPPGTFAGGISLGFCPNVLLPKPLCQSERLRSHPTRSYHEYIVEPYAGLATPWYAFDGHDDDLCPPATVQAFTSRVGSTQTVILPHVGHGFALPDRWFPEFRDIFSHLSGARSPS